MMKLIAGVFAALFLLGLSAEATPAGDRLLWKKDTTLAATKKYFVEDLKVFSGDSVSAEAFGLEVYTKAENKGLLPTEKLADISEADRTTFMFAYAKAVVKVNGFQTHGSYIPWAEVERVHKQFGGIAMPTMADAEAILAAVTTGASASAQVSTSVPTSLISPAKYTLAGAAPSTESASKPSGSEAELAAMEARLNEKVQALEGRVPSIITSSGLASASDVSKLTNRVGVVEGDVADLTTRVEKLEKGAGEQASTNQEVARRLGEVEEETKTLRDDFNKFSSALAGYVKAELEKLGITPAKLKELEDGQHLPLFLSVAAIGLIVLIGLLRLALPFLGKVFSFLLSLVNVGWGKKKSTAKHTDEYPRNTNLKDNFADAA